jgi:hypothetical protein
MPNLSITEYCEADLSITIAAIGHTLAAAAIGAMTRNSDITPPEKKKASCRATKYPNTTEPT